MSDNLFSYTYRIPSARAVWHAYNGGMYFVTICTKEHQHYFGEIDTNGMHMSAIGCYAEECIRQIPVHNPYAQVPLYVIMPNHVHMIVIIDEKTLPHEKRNIISNGNDVETVHAPSHGDNNPKINPLDGACTVSTIRDDNMVNDVVDVKMQTISRRKNKLSYAIGNFKSAITKYAHVNNIPFAWQTRFHDHIVRDTTEMNGIADYIENNVARWQTDRFYT